MIATIRHRGGTHTYEGPTLTAVIRDRVHPEARAARAGGDGQRLVTVPSPDGPLAIATVLQVQNDLRRTVVCPDCREARELSVSQAYAVRSGTTTGRCGPCGKGVRRP